MIHEVMTEETTMNCGPMRVDRAIPNGGTHKRLAFATAGTVVGCVMTLCAVHTYADDVKKEPPVLTSARMDYDREVKAVTKPIMQRYIAKLENMKKDLGGKGDAVGAIAVQQEIDKVKGAMSGNPASPTGDTASPITGTWIAQYGNGVTRTYEFLADGTLQMVDGGVVRAGQYKKDRSGVIVDLNDGKLDFWKKKTEKVWTIEHYNPKEIYRKGSPALTGVANRQE